MAFGLFRKRVPEPAAPAVEPKVPAAVVRDRDRYRRKAIRPRKSLSYWNSNSAAMIRQLERAANSVAGGAEATAATLSTIRQRTDALTGRTSAAQTHGDDLLARRRQVHPFGAGHRLAGARRRQARRPGQRRRPRSQRQCGSPAGVLGGDRQCRQSDRADRAADHAAGAQFHHRGRARRRGRARLRRRRHRGEGARGADPERHRGDHQEDRGAADATPPARSTPCIASRRRSRRSARCSRTSTARWPSRTQPPAKCPTTRLPPPASSSRSATAPPRSTARPRKPRPMAKASPRPARPSPRLRRSSNRAAPCCCGRSETRRSAASTQKLPCSLKIEIQTAARR